MQGWWKSDRHFLQSARDFQSGRVFSKRQSFLAKKLASLLLIRARCIGGADSHFITACLLMGGGGECLHSRCAWQNCHHAPQPVQLAKVDRLTRRTETEWNGTLKRPISWVQCRGQCIRMDNAKVLGIIHCLILLYEFENFLSQKGNNMVCTVTHILLQTCNYTVGNGCGWFTRLHFSG